MRIVPFLLLFILLIAACGEPPECEKNTDCQGSTCQIGKCADGACQYTPKDNCCGNDIRDKIENGLPGNPCTCPADYGNCSLAAKDAKYADILKAECNNEQDECVAVINASSDATEKSYDISSTSKYQLQANFKFDKPFNTKKNLFEFTLNPIMIADDIDAITLTHFKLEGTQLGKSAEILIDQNLNYVIKNSESAFTKGFVIQPTSTADVLEYTSLEGYLTWEYLKDTKSTANTQRFRNLLERREKFLVITLPKDYTSADCPPCDDGNPATRDYCPKGKAYCLHDFLPGTCGNFQCDPGENMCTCAHDCGACSGAYLLDSGKYSEALGKHCNGAICELQLEKPQKPLSKVSSSSTSGMVFQTELLANNPFDVRNDELQFSVKLQQLTDEDIIMPVKIIDVVITDRSNTKITSMSYTKNNTLSGNGDEWSVSYPTTSYYMDGRDVDTDIKYSIRLQYEKPNARGEIDTKYTTLQGTFMDWKFVQPGVMQ